MIDEGVFKNEWADLCERFRLTGEDEPSQRQMKRYYSYLSERMDTDSFREASEAVWARREFFPKPTDFVEAVQGDAEERAHEVWDAVLEMASDWRNARPSEVLDEAGQKALRQVGGVKKLALMDKADLDFRRKDFIAAYRVTSSRSEATGDLVPMTDDGEQLVEDAMAGRLNPSS